MERAESEDTAFIALPLKEEGAKAVAEVITARKAAKVFMLFRDVQVEICDDLRKIICIY
jgi:hypothetical protein